MAYGLLSEFASRNNDVGGYWALGKLYQHARACNVSEVWVDLVAEAITPSSAEFTDMIQHFQKKLSAQLVARGLPEEWLKDAAITVLFSGEKCAVRPGDIFECRVTLTDDLGRVRSAEVSGACWVHDPAKELRSGRAR